MRLLIIGRLSGELVTASKIAMSRGAAVTHADGVAQGLAVLRAKGADLVMIDVGQPIRELVTALADERIRTPVVRLRRRHRCQGGRGRDPGGCPRIHSPAARSGIDRRRVAGGLRGRTRFRLA